MRHLLGVLLISNISFAQQVTISGYIRDADSGENLIGATVNMPSQAQGATANLYGFYSLTLKAGDVALVYSYVGYKPETITFSLKEDTVINIGLTSASLLEEVVVQGDQPERVQETTRMSTITVPINQIKALPAMMGEVDVMKVLQLLPGVQAGMEGTTGLHVRGGGPDQNLILLDGVPVYNASHLYGFFSTFNADAINHVEIIKGGFPARYGGRLSSVVDISMKEGNQNKWHAQGTIGLISAKVAIEGPIKKDQTSFLFTARRSYLNLLKSDIMEKLRLGLTGNGLAENYYFYDVNAKINHRINSKNRVYLSTYFGADQMHSDSYNRYVDSTNFDEVRSSETTTNSDVSWGNTIAAARWNHLLGNKLFFNLSTTYSRYRLNTLNETITIDTTIASPPFRSFYHYEYQSGIRNVAAKVDFDWVINPHHYVRFGSHVIHHYFTPGVSATRSYDSLRSSDVMTSNVHANEVSAYVEDDWDIDDKLKVSVGLHAAAFLVGGREYFSLQPRLSVRQLMSADWSLKASYARMQQFTHLLSNPGLGLPTDLWVPATARVRPQISDQVAIGAARNFGGGYVVTVEGYYKTMNHVIEYKDGASYLNTDSDWENKVTAGRGRSYGVELLAQKKIGSLSGWAGYTLSWTDRKFESINDGRWFPYRFDRRHDAKFTCHYTYNSHFDLGMTWVFGTGNAVTIPLEQFFTTIPGGVYPSDIKHYSTRNSFRMRNYHRLDLNINYNFKAGNTKHRVSASVYNAYKRRNPFYLEFVFNPEPPPWRILKQVSLFPLMPSITYSITF